MEIAITGASGLIGSHLRRSLTQKGHRPVALVRRPAAADDEIAWDPIAGTIDAASLAGIDAVVHLAGAGIGDKRWSDERRKEIYNSRIGSTRLLTKTFAEMDRPPKTFLSGSAIGYYGNRGDEKLTEQSAPGKGFLADLCVDWEAAALQASPLDIRVVLLRTGIVLTTAGGVLPKLLPLFRLGLGGRFGSGEQWWPWIAITDHVAAVEYLLTNPVTGPVNMTAPNPATNKTVTKSLGRVLGRPTFLTVPTFGPKLLMGADMTQALIFDSARVLPAVLEAEGFSFAYAELDDALDSMLGRDHEVAS